MRPLAAVRIARFVCALSLTMAAGLTAQVVPPDPEGFIIAFPDDIAAVEGRQRLLFGNPREPGLYVVQLVWEPGQGSRPHFHDQARLINVLEGTWYVSTGAASDVYDPDSMVPVPAGTFIYEPPNGHHYDMAKDERVVVQIMGIGPVNTTQIPQPGDPAAR